MATQRMQMQQELDIEQGAHPRSHEEQLCEQPLPENQSDQEVSVSALIQSAPEVVGSLHGKPCSLEDYVKIPSDFGSYDLIDGVLVAHPMADAIHDDILTSLHDHISEHIRSRRLSLVIYIEPSIFIPRMRRYRRPDLAVARDGPRPSSAGSVGFPKDYPPPVFVVEVTSQNRGNDLGHKLREYESAGISQYVIIDRDTPHQGRDAAVHVHSLVTDSYQRKTFTGDHYVKCNYLEGVTASQLLKPSDLRSASSRNKAREDDKVRELEAKLRKSEQKRRYYKQKASKHGASVSPSSSSPVRSPVKKRAKHTEESTRIKKQV